MPDATFAIAYDTDGHHDEFPSTAAVRGALGLHAALLGAAKPRQRRNHLS